jgi:hypothetical protein
MKRILIVTTIAIALLGGQVFAETDPANEIDKRWAAIAEAQQMQQKHMAMMQATMEKIQTADDPAVRKQLMHEHMQEMRTMMGMMGKQSGMDLMGGQMMAGHAQGEGMQHDAAAMPMCKEDTAQCRQMNTMAKHQEYMAKELAMTQMMMQQMMERNAAHEGKESHEH